MTESAISNFPPLEPISNNEVPVSITALSFHSSYGDVVPSIFVLLIVTIHLLYMPQSVGIQCRFDT